MREGTVDQIRIRAEGSVEVLERAVAQLTLAARTLDTGEAKALAAVTEDELRAYDEVVRLDGGHDSVKRFDAARAAFGEARARWAMRYGVEPAQHLPVLFEARVGVRGTSWLKTGVGVSSLVFFLSFFLDSKLRRYRPVPLTVTSKALLVDGKEVPLDTIDQVVRGRDDTIIVTHREGAVTFWAGKERDAVMAELNRTRLLRP